jgi:SPP1 family phage portal protein
MLNFGMETKRINDIVTAGSKTISDIKFLEREIQKFITSPARRMMIDGDMYYDYEQAIKHKRRMVIGKDGQMQEDKQLPNNKFTDNQYAAMVDQKNNYLLAKPITFKTENEQYADALKNIFNKKFHRLLKNLGKDSYNGGIAWLYPYYDEQGTKIGQIDSSTHQTNSDFSYII